MVLKILGWSFLTRLSCSCLWSEGRKCLLQAVTTIGLDNSLHFHFSLRSDKQSFSLEIYFLWLNVSSGQVVIPSSQLLLYLEIIGSIAFKECLMFLFLKLGVFFSTVEWEALRMTILFRSILTDKDSHLPSVDLHSTYQQKKLLPELNFERWEAQYLVSNRSCFILWLRTWNLQQGFACCYLWHKLVPTKWGSGVRFSLSVSCCRQAWARITTGTGANFRRVTPSSTNPTTDQSALIQTLNGWSTRPTSENSLKNSRKSFIG